MNLKELENLLTDGESGTVECKETTGQRVEACRTLCAFLNGRGGTVVFGVTKRGEIVGQLVTDETKRDLAHVFYDIEPGTEVSVEYVPVDATHQVIVCHVERGARRPYVYDGRPYKRVESTTVRMPQEEYDALLADRKGFVSDWDITPANDLTFEDLDETEIRRTARMAVAAGRLEASADTDDVKALLRKFRMMRGGRLLNAAAVLFGKDLTLYPQCHLKLAWFRGKTKMEFRDTGDVYGNVFELFDAAMAFLFKHLNLSGVIKGMFREEELEIPADALREVVINALAHRLYMTPGTAVAIAVYDDRVEISNPGSFPPELPTDILMDGNEHDSVPRNQRIAEVLYKRKTIEVWGRGMALIRRACEEAGVAAPRYSSDGRFVKVVFMRRAGSTEKATTGKRLSTPKKTRGKTETIGKKTIGKRTIGKTSEATIDVLRADGTLTILEIARILGITEVGVRYQLRNLKMLGRIRRVGGRKFGHWEVSGS